MFRTIQWKHLKLAIVLCQSFKNIASILQKNSRKRSYCDKGVALSGSWLPWDLSMAWWRFMGSTDVVMLSPSASSRLLWVSASPVRANRVAEGQSFGLPKTHRKDFPMVAYNETKSKKNKNKIGKKSSLRFAQIWLRATQWRQEGPQGSPSHLMFFPPKAKEMLLDYCP